MRSQYKVLAEAYNRVLETSKPITKEDTSNEWYNDARKQIDSSDGAYGFSFFKTIKDWPHPDEFIKFLCKHIYGVSVDYFEIVTYGIDKFITTMFGHEVDSIAGDIRDKNPHLSHKEINDISDKLAVKKLKEYYNQFKTYQKAQAVLKKGSEESGVDIDI